MSDPALPESAYSGGSGYAAIFHSADDGMLLADPAGKITDVNPAACRLLGRAREDLVGSELTGLFDPSYLFLETALQTGIEKRPFKGGVRLLNGAGASFPAEAALTVDSAGGVAMIFRTSPDAGRPRTACGRARSVSRP